MNMSGRVFLVMFIVFVESLSVFPAHTGFIISMIIITASLFIAYGESN
jgi:hypothetical protein